MKIKNKLCGGEKELENSLNDEFSKTNTYDIDESNIDLQNIVKNKNIKTNKIELVNRYNDNIWLEHIDKDLWQLKSDDPKIFHYIRIIYEEDNKTICAIDPSGGPYLKVGDYINKSYRIEEIFPNGLILRLS